MKIHELADQKKQEVLLIIELLTSLYKTLASSLSCFPQIWTSYN